MEKQAADDQFCENGGFTLLYSYFNGEERTHEI